MASAAATEDDVLAALFSERYLPMVRLASWLTGDPATGEDVVQDAFVRIARADLHNVEAVDAYLRTTVVNLTRTQQKRVGLRRRHRVIELPITPGPEATLGDEELAAAVAGLPRRQRECVVLRFAEDLTVAAIAEALSISRGSVKTHLHRGLKSLEQTLSPETSESKESRP